MREGGTGSSINFGSVAGLSGYPSTSYCASRWAIVRLTTSAAIELAERNIRVNAICPGNVDRLLARGSATTFDLVSRFTPQQRAA